MILHGEVSVWVKKTENLQEKLKKIEKPNGD